MQILVFSRKEAEQVKCDNPHIWISITDPLAPDANLSSGENCVDILRLKFHDLDPTSHGALYLFQDKLNAVFMGVDHAHQIRGFVQQHKEKVEKILVHCEAGISRSAGVAEALEIALGGQQTNWRKLGKHPNIHVKLLILNNW